MKTHTSGSGPNMKPIKKVAEAIGSFSAAAATAPSSSSHFSSFNRVFPSSSRPPSLNLSLLPPPTSRHVSSLQQRTRTRASLDGKGQSDSSPFLVQEKQDEDEEEGTQSQPSTEVKESVIVLKNAAKTRKVAAEEVLSALSVIEKAKIDSSGFLDTLGGSESPGRTWMLIFTAEKQLKGGRYFPLTAIQRFDAAGRRIENGVYLGPVGCLTFEGRFSWKKRVLAFIFERIRIKVGPLNPFEISLGQKEDRVPNTKDPFFIWFYVDEEIAVARGRSGGTAFWCRCCRVTA